MSRVVVMREAIVFSRQKPSHYPYEPHGSRASWVLDSDMGGGRAIFVCMIRMEVGAMGFRPMQTIAGVHSGHFDNMSSR